jgi:hypothetical protein
VKFKYEKLRIFCFVRGIMGHAENKCEVRFSMEQDDGVREWSPEIRAESRRPGGKLVSRWLREERGGRSEPAAVEQAFPVTGNAGVVPTNADMAHSNHIRSQNPTPNHHYSHQCCAGPHQSYLHKKPNRPHLTKGNRQPDISLFTTRQTH